MTPWYTLVLFATWMQAAAQTPERLRAAVERVESHSNPLVKSSAGCIGVMQVCPRWSLVPADALWDVNVNRMEGTRILDEMRRHAGGYWRRALAGYVCGNRGLRGECGDDYARRVLALARKKR